MFTATTQSQVRSVLFRITLRSCNAGVATFICTAAAIAGSVLLYLRHKHKAEGTGTNLEHSEALGLPQKDTAGEGAIHTGGSLHA
jgi:hypothetical protein